MVQKEQVKRPRGRPRAYEPDAALARAMDVFWRHGYSATSLDTLSEATGMNRPSLYGAFGDKQALYLKALERYAAGSREMLTRAFGADRPLRDALLDAYRSALAIYTGNGPRGCFFIGTAATEAATNPVVREVFATSLRELDEAFEARMRAARKRGEIPGNADPAMLGRFAASVIHTLALRARAGESRTALEATIRGAVELICGPAPKRGKAK